MIHVISGTSRLSDFTLILFVNLLELYNSSPGCYTFVQVTSQVFASLFIHGLAKDDEV